MKTIYPKGYVQKKCIVCNWCSNPVKIPEKMPKNDQLISTKQQINDIFNAEWWKL
jgi:hypothetical protein